MTALDTVLGRLPDARRCGAGWTARCPAHDDRHASLSIDAGDGGRVLLCCHAGCSAEAIVEAMGLGMRDLLPADGNGRNGAHSGNGHALSARPAKKYASARAAIAALARSMGQPSDQWTYYDATAEPVGMVVRWDRRDGKKDIRPVALVDGAWVCGGMPEPRPLYRLPELSCTERVYVTEGERCADAARSIGLTATTSPHGATSAGKADWSPLEGREVVILPDHDDAGRQYAETVAAILSGLSPPAIVRIVDLPGLADGEDIVDYLAAHPGIAPAELRRRIDAMAYAAEPWQPTAEPWQATAALPAPATVAAWPPLRPYADTDLPRFPVDALPGALARWVDAEAIATQTPADLAGLLALAVCSATLARRVEIVPRDGWREPVNIYVAVLLGPGNRKSAVFRDASKPLRDIERALVDGARPEVARMLSRRRQAEARLRRLERAAAKSGDEAASQEAEELAARLAEEPEPTLPKLIIDEATAEKIGIELAAQGGRIASMSAEGGVIDLMRGLYHRGAPQIDVYLRGHAGDDLIVDRVSRASLRVERPAITCAYAVQPEVVRGIVRHTAFRGRGLMARYLYAMPASLIGERAVGEPPVPAAVRDDYHAAIGALHHGDCPTELRLTAEAHRAMVSWEATIEGMLADGGEMEGIRDWGGKLAGATLRLAAVLHRVDRADTDSVGAAVLDAAIAIARYLIPHAVAVLSMAGEDRPIDDGARYVLRWIRRHGLTWFSARDAYQAGKRRFRFASELDGPLAELVARGYIRVVPEDRSGPGRPPSTAYEVRRDVCDGASRPQYPQYSPAADAPPNIGDIGGAIRGQKIDDDGTTGEVPHER